MSKVNITTYRPFCKEVRSTKKYDSYEDFLDNLQELCRLSSFRAEILGWDNCIGNFLIEDEYGIMLIGVIEAVGNFQRITVDEFLELID
jgi:hypothetical protein